MSLKFLALVFHWWGVCQVAGGWDGEEQPCQVETKHAHGIYSPFDCGQMHTTSSCWLILVLWRHRKCNLYKNQLSETYAPSKGHWFRRRKCCHLGSFRPRFITAVSFPTLQIVCFWGGPPCGVSGITSEAVRDGVGQVVMVTVTEDTWDVASGSQS